MISRFAVARDPVRMRASREANAIVPHADPPPERLVEFGGVDAVQSDQLPRRWCRRR